jgi:streptomycin 6-kinase
VSGRLAPWLARWDLALDGPPPQVRYQGLSDPGEVAFVRRGAARLVLKLLPDQGDETRMAEVLAHWDGRGAVRLIAAAPGAVLMERALPGGDLVELIEAEGDAAATLAAAQVMAALRRPAPASGAFRSIGDWGQAFERARPKSVAVGFDAGLIERAGAVYAELAATQAAPVLLHGDLHHHNILGGGARGWLAIDPKGVLGEPAYETGALLRNPIETPELCADETVIAARAQLLAERLGYDLRRILGWGFSQWVLACLWAVEDGIAFAPEWLAGPRAAERLFMSA